MMRMHKVTLLFLMGTLVSACAVYSEKSPRSSVSEQAVCEDPRPQICTSEYNPVCASYKDGSKKTASTGCTACSDYEVAGHMKGACETATAD